MKNDRTRREILEHKGKIILKLFNLSLFFFENNFDD